MLRDASPAAFKIVKPFPAPTDRASSLDSAMSPQPVLGTVKKWCAVSGMSTSQAYKCIALGQLLAFKVPGTTRTLIDIERGLAWLRSQPPLQLGKTANIAPPVLDEQRKRIVRSSPE